MSSARVPSSGPGPVWVVAGAPGAGKSTVADLLRQRLSPPPAILDKDVLFAGFVGEVQDAHGIPRGQREGEWYDRHVKVHEYAGMTAGAAQIRSSGAAVILVAPFTTHIRDLAHWRSWTQALGGDPVHLVWVAIPPITLRQRLIERASPLDRGKLADWDTFVSRMLPQTPPPVPHHRIDTGGSLDDLAAQVQTLAARA